MPEHKKATLKEELREELQSIYNVRSDLTLGLLADGAVDGVLLSLHGSFWAQGDDDVDGTVLQRGPSPQRTGT